MSKIVCVCVCVCVVCVSGACGYVWVCGCVRSALECVLKKIESTCVSLQAVCSRTADLSGSTMV